MFVKQAEIVLNLYMGTETLPALPTEICAIIWSYLCRVEGSCGMCNRRCIVKYGWLKNSISVYRHSMLSRRFAEGLICMECQHVHTVNVLAGRMSRVAG